MHKGFKVNCMIQFIRVGAEMIGYFIIGVIIVGLLSQLLYRSEKYDKKSN
jgi:hypothetical protein